MNLCRWKKGDSIMNNKKENIYIPLLLGLLLIASTSVLFGSDKEPISFRGGFTRAVMKEGQESIILSQGAMVSTGDILFKATTIELIGANARYITATGAVSIIDKVNNIEITCSEISFDRTKEQMIADGWIEIQDLKNEVIASGAYLSYDVSEGIIKLQIVAKLLHHTSSGPMICRADSITFNRNTRQLMLVGNTSVEWKGDSYKAMVTTINLDTEEIIMEGTITGTMYG